MYEELLNRCGKKQYVGLVETNGAEALLVHLCSPFVLNRPNKTNQPDPFFVRDALEKGSGYL